MKPLSSIDPAGFLQVATKVGYGCRKTTDNPRVQPGRPHPEKGISAVSGQEQIGCNSVDSSAEFSNNSAKDVWPFGRQTYYIHC
jgi:hypothetical protein